MAKRHPHTNAVSIASDTMAKVIGTFGHDPRFMQHPPKKMPLHPDDQRVRQAMTQAMFDRLTKRD